MSNAERPVISKTRKRAVALATTLAIGGGGAAGCSAEFLDPQAAFRDKYPDVCKVDVKPGQTPLDAALLAKPQGADVSRFSEEVHLYNPKPEALSQPLEPGSPRDIVLFPCNKEQPAPPSAPSTPTTR